MILAIGLIVTISKNDFFFFNEVKVVTNDNLKKDKIKQCVTMTQKGKFKMNCYRGKCKHNNQGNCNVDNQPCDYTKEPFGTTGTFDEHCRHEYNEKLISNECRAFFSCYNCCAYYDTCEET